MIMLFGSLFSCLLALSFASSQIGRPVQAELGQLEAAVARGSITPAQRLKLAEIYFLTSRCDDVKKTLAKVTTPDATLLKCVCGGKCPSQGDEAKVQQFQKLLEKGARWNDARVRKLWRAIKDIPEAKYWAVKNLRGRRESGIQNVRLDLERSLESLEVKP